jgi:hypothetical protein
MDLGRVYLIVAIELALISSLDILHIKTYRLKSFPFLIEHL